MCLIEVHKQKCEVAERRVCRGSGVGLGKGVRPAQQAHCQNPEHAQSFHHGSLLGTTAPWVPRGYHMPVNLNLKPYQGQAKKRIIL
jgi:hypothetical protein